MWLAIAFRYFSQVQPQSVFNASIHESPASSVDISAAAASGSSPLDGLPSFALIILAFGCLALAAAVAGLTLGLMSLDSTALDIVMNSSDPIQAEAARVIKPVREEGNLLLVTLLLSNTLAAEFLPLVLDALVPGGIFSLIVSVLSLLLFGEMIPQAVCSRHPLYFGAKLIGFVRILRIILYPVAAPIAFLLDFLLGEELGTIYSREELKNLIDVHANSKVLTIDESTMLKGTLDFTQKTVHNIMTEEKHVFALDIDDVLDRETMITILKKGHSRIPLYEGSKSNIICLLLVKQLILVNPNEREPVRIRGLISNLQTNHKIRVAPAWECSATTRISDLLNCFQIGRSHLAVVYDDLLKDHKERKFLGIVTIEDIIEEILQEEIIDETDLYVDNTNQQKRLIQNKEGRYVPSPPAATPIGSVAHSTEDLSKTLRMRIIDFPAIRRPLDEDKLKKMVDSVFPNNNDEIQIVSGLPIPSPTDGPSSSQQKLPFSDALPQYDKDIVFDDNLNDFDDEIQQRYDKDCASEPSFGSNLFQEIGAETKNGDYNRTNANNISDGSLDRNRNKLEVDTERSVLLPHASADNLFGDNNSTLKRRVSRRRITSTTRIHRLLGSGVKNATVIRKPSWIAGPMLGVARRSSMSLLEDDDNDVLPEDIVMSEQMDLRDIHNSQSGTKLRPVPDYASSEREQIPIILQTNRVKRLSSKRTETDGAINEAIGNSSISSANIGTDYGSVSINVSDNKSIEKEE